MKTQHNRSWQRLALFITGVVIAIFGVVGTGAGTASAHHADLTASVTCDRIVTWSTEAWDGWGDPVARTNPDVRVYYQRGSDQGVVPLLNGAFNAGNGYSLSGQFTFPDGEDYVIVWVATLGTWGNDGGGGQTSFVKVYNPKPCNTTTVPATTTTVPVTTTTVPATTTTVPATTTTVPATTTTVPATTTTTVPATTTTVPATTTTVPATTTTVPATTTTVPATTTTVPATTTTVPATTTTVPATTTTVLGTTTTVVATTTTIPATTTTEVGSGGPTTTTTVAGTTTTTVLGSGGPTTTVAGSLPRTGGSSGSLGLISLGLLLIGASFMLTTRRPAV